MKRELGLPTVLPLNALIAPMLSGPIHLALHQLCLPDGWQVEKPNVLHTLMSNLVTNKAYQQTTSKDLTPGDLGGGWKGLSTAAE